MNKFRGLRQTESGNIIFEVPSDSGWRECVYCEHQFKKRYPEAYNKLKNE